MKTIISLVSIITTLAMSSAMAQTTFTGTGNSLGNGTQGEGAGVSSVMVNNTASTISFTLNTTGPQASYIFYAIELQIIGQSSSGYTGFANPFGTFMGISTGENALIDTFGTGATAYTANNAGFTSSGSVLSYVGGTGTQSTTITTSLSSLGLSVGQSFYLDVISGFTSNPSGQSADGALDSVTGYPAESDNSFNPFAGGGANFYDSANAGASGSTFGTAATEYTIAAVPEPTTSALMGLGALVMISRVRRNAR
jgi:hypothetical protein